MPLKTHADEQPSMNLTPMIDVVFLLIIFFMVGTKFSEIDRKITVTLPQVGEAAPLTAPPDRRVVTVDTQGQVSLDDEPCELSQLVDRLRGAVSEYPALAVIVCGDAACPFQGVASALGACREAGIAEMSITVRLDDKTRR